MFVIGLKGQLKTKLIQWEISCTSTPQCHLQYWAAQTFAIFFPFFSTFAIALCDTQFENIDSRLEARICLYLYLWLIYGTFDHWNDGSGFRFYFVFICVDRSQPATARRSILISGGCGYCMKRPGSFVCTLCGGDPLLLLSYCSLWPSCAQKTNIENEPMARLRSAHTQSQENHKNSIIAVRPTWPLVAFNLASIPKTNGPILYFVRSGTGAQPPAASPSIYNPYIHRTYFFQTKIFFISFTDELRVLRWWAKDGTYTRTLWRSRRWHKYLFFYVERLPTKFTQRIIALQAAEQWLHKHNRIIMHTTERSKLYSWPASILCVCVCWTNDWVRLWIAPLIMATWPGPSKYVRNC